MTHLTTLDLLKAVYRIKTQAEGMSLQELDDLACGDGWLAFIDEEPQLAGYLSDFVETEEVVLGDLLTDMVMSVVSEIYEKKSNMFVVVRKPAEYAEVDSVLHDEYWNGDDPWGDYKKARFYNREEAMSIAQSVATSPYFVYRVYQMDEAGFVLLELDV